MRNNQPKQKILFTSPSVAAGKEQEPSRNDFVSLTGKPIGEGAFGDVWKVRHKASGNVFAIKCVLKSKIIECKMQEQLNREIRIMYSLNHPNIIKLFNHFEDNDFCYLILEFAPNESLWSFLNRKKTLDEATAAQYIREMALAVEYLHNKDPPIIHRDIKPENILLDSNFSAKLCDFGWSNFFNEDRTRKTYCGTLDYLAPEMIKKQGHNTSLDLWNLGVLLYELLTGKAPFQGKNQQELFEKITKVQINWPKGFPPLAKDLILRLLKTNPEEHELNLIVLLEKQLPMTQVQEKNFLIVRILFADEGEIQLKENDYVVVSTPQSKLQYQNLKIQETVNLNQTEEVKVNISNQQVEQPSAPQLEFQESTTESSQSTQQQAATETEIEKFNQKIQDLEEKITNPEVQSTQQRGILLQKMIDQLQQKETDIKTTKTQIEEVKLKIKEVEQDFNGCDADQAKDKDEYSTLCKLKLLLKHSLLHQVNVSKDELELLKAHLTEMNQQKQSKLDEQQVTYCKESLSKLNSQLNFESNLQQYLGSYEAQQQKLAEQCKKLGLQQEVDTSSSSSGLTNVIDQNQNQEGNSQLQQKLKESQEQLAKYKEQIQIIKKFWDIDKQKLEDMKKQVSNYENIVNNYHQNFK